MSSIVEILSVRSHFHSSVKEPHLKSTLRAFHESPLVNCAVPFEADFETTFTQDMSMKDACKPCGAAKPALIARDKNIPNQSMAFPQGSEMDLWKAKPYSEVLFTGLVVFSGLKPIIVPRVAVSPASVPSCHRAIVPPQPSCHRAIVPSCHRAIVPSCHRAVMSLQCPVLHVDLCIAQVRDGIIGASRLCSTSDLAVDHATSVINNDTLCNIIKNKIALPVDIVSIVLLFTAERSLGIEPTTTEKLLRKFSNKNNISMSTSLRAVDVLFHLMKAPVTTSNDNTLNLF